MQLRLIHQLGQDIKDIEKAVMAGASAWPCYRRLQTLPGVGIILSLTITLETADPKRFAQPGHYASYCRCVEAKRLTNGKKKDRNNGKCGNSYLGWAWVEAANFAQRFDQDCRRFYDRKKEQTNSVVATKALACKLAKAAWYIMSQEVVYDSKRMFPH
jgi:transposase